MPPLLVLIVLGVLYWIGFMVLFAIVAAVIAIGGAELERRRVPYSDLEGLGAFALPLVFYGSLCLVAAVWGMAFHFSVANLARTVVVFLPGALLGSAVIYMGMPFWIAWRERQREPASTG